MLTHILLTALNAVAPIILMIAFGYLLKRIKFLDEAFLKTGNKLVFHVCIPVMLFLNIYSINSIDQLRWDMVLFCLAVILVVFGVGAVIAWLSTKDPLRRGVVWQCSFRSNFAIIGLPLAETLGGKSGAAMAAVLSAFAVPAFNVGGVIALATTTGTKKSPGSVLRSIATNPLTLGVAAGLLALLIRMAQTALFGRVVFSLQRDLPFLHKALGDLKAVTTPLALIVLGGQCEFSAVKGMLRELVAGVTARVVLVPALAICSAVALSHIGLLPCGNGEYAALIALFGSPVAVASAIMAGNMGADKQLATQLVVWTSLTSVLTIFLTVCILMATGLLVI